MWHLSIVCFFLSQSGKSWFGCVTVSLTTHPLKDISFGSCFGTLWTKCYEHLCRYRCQCEHKPPFLWHKCLRVELLSQMVSVCLVLLEAAPLFSRVAVPLCTPAVMHRGSIPSPAFRVSIDLICVHQGVKGMVFVWFTNFIGSQCHSWAT